MMPNPAFILASGSPRRRELLASLGIEFTVIKSDIDETQRPGEAPLAYVLRLSNEKARAVADKMTSPVVVLAADTVVILAADTIGVMDGEILGKPTDADDARAMLQRLRNRPHTVCTALTLVCVKSAQSSEDWTRLTTTEVTMRDYTDAEIDAYIATGDPFDKAGSYAIQHEGFRPVARIDGSYTNVVGLPVETLKGMLVEMGFSGQ
jgi:nucleoside triphosphate pyrophosphatase